MVSPVDKGGGDIVAPERPLAGPTEFSQAAGDGERVTYTSTTNFGDDRGAAPTPRSTSPRAEPGAGRPTRSTRRRAGRSSTPHFEDIVDLQNAFQAFTPDLCQALMVDQNYEPLSPDAIHGYTDLYWRAELRCRGGEL